MIFCVIIFVNIALKKIIKNNSLSSDNKIFAKVLVAKFSVSQEIWGEAKSILETIKESEMPKEGFEILAEIASSQNNTNDVRTYLKQAANTKVGFGYLCKSCGYDNGINDILCPSCNDVGTISWGNNYNQRQPSTCLLYTSPSPRDRTRSRMPSSA